MGNDEATGENLDLYLSIILKFSSKSTEKNYKRFKQIERKKIMKYIFVGVICIFVSFLVKSVTNPNFVSILNCFVFSVIGLTVAVCYRNFKWISKFIEIGDQSVYLLVVISLAVSCTWAIEKYDDSVTSLSCCVYISEAVFAIPLILGTFLDIHIIVLFCCQVLLMLCQFCILHKFAKTYHTNVFLLEVQSCIGALLSVAVVYVMIRNDRMAFLQKQRLISQERGKVESRYENQRAAVQQIIEAKGRYIAQVAHDIGTPLATFSLAIELLQSYAETLEVRDILETAQCAIELMTVTRREALDHAKHLEGMELCPSLKEVKLTEIIQRCARLIQHLSTQSKFQTEFYLDSFLPKQIFTDYDWIWTMLTNFLSNAQKYSNKGKLVTTMFEIEARPVNMLRVEVSDEGIGVPPDRMHLLFKPFAQLMKSAGGTGLGLHGVSMKAKALGGSVGVRENPASSTGSTFWFEIPCTAVSDELASAGTPLPDSILFVGKWPSVIVEDCLNFLDKRFMEVRVLDSHEEYCMQTEAAGIFYSFIFWYLDESLMKQSTECLVSLATSMKSHIEKQSSNGRSSVVYVSCANLESTSSLDLVCGSNEEKLEEEDQSKENTKNKKSRRKSALSLLENPKTAVVVPGLFESSCSHLQAISSMSNLELDREQKFRTKRILTSSCSAKYHPRDSAEGAQAYNLLEASKIEKVVKESQIGMFLRYSLNADDIKSLVLQSAMFRVNTPPKLGLTSPKLSRQAKEKDLQETEDSKESFRAGPLPSFTATVDRAVLVVDDESSILKFVSKMLEKNGYHVTSRTNGFDAWILLKEQQFGVAIIDRSMPVMDGIECIRRFREWEQLQLVTGERQLRQPIIMHSANASRSYIEEALATGADEFVAKPVKINDLVDTICKVQGIEMPIREKLHRSANCNLKTVDDNSSLVKMSEKVLTKRGYEVFTGCNGAEALQLMTDPNNHFDAVIIDHQMPIMDGLECINRFRRWEEAFIQTKELQEANHNSLGSNAQVNTQLLSENCSTLTTSRGPRTRPKIILLSGGDVSLEQHVSDGAVLKKIDKVFLKPVNYDRLIEWLEK